MIALYLASNANNYHSNFTRFTCYGERSLGRDFSQGNAMYVKGYEQGRITVRFMSGNTATSVQVVH